MTEPTSDRAWGSDGARAPFDLGGRVAVVTGGSAGVGLGIATALGRAGARVSIWGRDEGRLARATDALAAQGIVVAGVRADATDEDDVDSAMAATVDELGEPDVVVANVGRGPDLLSIVDTSLATWEDSLRGNLTATFLCFRAAARRMVPRGEGGSLVAVSSVMSILASPLRHHYAAPKAGLHALVCALAHELAPARIRCNTLVPGFTESNRVVPAAMTPRRRAVLAASIPAGRVGRPADVGAAAVYLADPSLPYLTGDIVFADGGLRIMSSQDAAEAAWDAAVAAVPDQD